MAEDLGTQDAEATRGAQARVLRAAIEAGADRTPEALCKAADVPLFALLDWLDNDSAFIAAWDRIWVGCLRLHLPSVVAATAAKAMAGDVNAARLVADLAGVVTQRIAHGGDAAAPIVTASAIAHLDGEDARRACSGEPIRTALRSVGRN